MYDLKDKEALSRVKETMLSLSDILGMDLTVYPSTERIVGVKNTSIPSVGGSKLVVRAIVTKSWNYIGSLKQPATVAVLVHIAGDLNLALMTTGDNNSDFVAILMDSKEGVLTFPKVDQFWSRKKFIYECAKYSVAVFKQTHPSAEWGEVSNESLNQYILDRAEGVGSSVATQRAGL